MVDPLSVAAAGAAKAIDPAAAEAAKVGGKLMINLFGPVTEQMGLDLLEKYKNRNVQRVAELAAKKTAGAEGSIPPRVGGAVFEASAFADDELVAEYLSGVLASSRSIDGKDDSGVSWTALVARLSVDQLKLHYLLYSTAAFCLSDLDFDSLDAFTNNPVYLPVETLLVALTGGGVGAGRFNESLMNLVREGLISDRYAVHTDPKVLSPDREIPDGPGMVYRVSPSGVGLYLWGLGLGRSSVLQFQKVSVALPEGAAIEVPVRGASRLDQMPPRTAEAFDGA